MTFPAGPAMTVGRFSPAKISDDDEEDSGVTSFVM
jgi:hypothetical protein